MPDRDHNGSIPNSWLHVAGFIVVLCAAASDAMAQMRDVLVTEVRGTVAKSVQKGTQPIRALDTLKAGDRVRLSSDSQVSLFTSADARLYVVDGPAEVSIGARDITANGKVAAARQLDDAYRNVKVSSPELVQGSMVMRGANSVRLAAPQGAVTEPNARQFRWRGDDSAWRFELATDDGRLMHRAEIRGQVYALPQNVVLEPGMKYVWGIGSAATDAPPLDWTEFVVDAQAPDRIEPAARLVHAAWLNERGLRRAAQRLLEDRSSP